jgi:hypothetical protein
VLDWLKMIETVTHGCADTYFGGSIVGGAIRNFRAQCELHPFRAMRHYFVEFRRKGQNENDSTPG